MTVSKEIEDLQPGDTFIHAGSLFVCLCVTRGSMDVTNLHAVTFDDLENGRTGRDYLFTSRTPRKIKVASTLPREHIVVDLG